MIKYLGTHNSGTSSKLVWWQRILTPILNATSSCQTLSIEDQLKNNVRLFNLQITYYRKEWVFSHGACIYTGKLYDAIYAMIKYATKESPVYFQLFLDKNFLLGQNKNEFKKLVTDLLDILQDTNVYMLYAYIEGTDEYPYKNSNINLSISEHYWTKSWAENNAKSWIDKLPLPKHHAKIYNNKYMDENTAHYLMLDFIEIGKHFIEIGNHLVNIGNKTINAPVVTTKPNMTIAPTITPTITSKVTNTPQVTIAPTVTPTHSHPTTMPPFTVKASDNKQYSGIEFLNVEGQGGTVYDKMTVKQLPYSGSLTFDAPQIKIYSNNYSWSYKLYNGTTKTVKKGVVKTFNSGELYNVKLTVNVLGTPKPTHTSTPTVTPSVTTTSSPLSIVVHYNGKQYVYNEGDYVLYISNNTFNLIFDKCIPNTYYVNSVLNLNTDWSLYNVQMSVVPDGGYSGCLCITGNISTAYSGVANIYLYDVCVTPTETPTHKVTTTPKLTPKPTSRVTSTPTPTVTPISTGTTVTPTPTVNPTELYSYSFVLSPDGKLTNNNAVPVYAHIYLHGDTLSHLDVNCNSKYAYFTPSYFNISGKQQVSTVIGYIHPHGNATANYRFNIVGTAYTNKGNVFNTYCSTIIYGKSNVATPTPTSTSNATSTPTPTVTPTTT